ncbi:MAG: glycoside hydrolase family 25 protein [Lachnospiraceae bacterium]|nr:glycoside hydrolase family 25 protein [Lachnospiraceae bacterium]
MDSKTKRLTALLLSLVILLVVGAIVLVNYQELIGNKGVNGEESAVMFQNMETEADGKVKGADLSAFLKDDTFFDAEEKIYDGIVQVTEEETDVETDVAASELTLMATSVERDLRVRIVDKSGNPVEGYGFKISVEGTGTYKDLDEDGIIYVSGLKAGDYKIVMQEQEGFDEVAAPLTVSVKANITYTPIEDISYLIKAESEIDTMTEDTDANDVQEKDADETQYTKLLEADQSGEPIQLGIDVSKWQKEIDWELVAAEGVDFAIIRCGYRGSSSGYLVEDPYFAQNIKGATEAGIKVGVYFFTQAVNAVEAVEEASMVISLLGDYALDYPIFIDTEGAGGDGRADGLDVETRTAVCETFCKTIENAGYEAGVYASRSWYYTMLNTDKINDYTIWLAEYRQTPLYDDHYEMWQYTSKGSVAGIEGNVDLNVSYLGF